mgnify:CR=1 FL=1
MSNKDFSVELIISNTWHRFKHNALFWILLTVLTILISLPGNYMPSLGGLLTIINIYLSASITLMTIRYMRGKKVNWGDLLAIDIYTFIQYVLTLILSTFCIILGLFCLILPGLYVMVRLMFAQYLVIDKKISFDQAIKQSWNVTKSNEWNLFAFLCAMFILNLVGFISLLVGLLITLPLTNLCTAALYLIFAKTMSMSNKSE